MRKLEAAAVAVALIVAGPARPALQDAAPELVPLQSADPADSMLALQQDQRWRERLLEADLDRHEIDRLRSILAVLDAQEATELATRVREYLIEEYGQAPESLQPGKPGEAND